MQSLALVAGDNATQHVVSCASSRPKQVKTWRHETIFSDRASLMKRDALQTRRPEPSTAEAAETRRSLQVSASNEGNNLSG